MLPDTSIVDLHRLSGTAIVTRVDGDAYRVLDEEEVALELVADAELSIPEATARSAGALPLFFCDEAVFVAMSSVSIAKLRRVMQALGRPVNPHLVEESVLGELLDRVHGGRRRAVSSPS